MTAAPAAGDSAAVAVRLAPAIVAPDAVERPITVDQTNHSVVVGDAVVVKWLRAPVPPPQRGAQLLSHLAAVGFAEMPTLFGVEEIDGRIVAIVTSYVAASRDGWQWYVADLTGDLDVGDADAVDRHGAPAGSDRRAIARGVGDAVDGDHRSGAPRDARRREDARRSLARRSAATRRRTRPGSCWRRSPIASSPISPSSVTPVRYPCSPCTATCTSARCCAAASDIVVIDFDGDPVSTPPGGFDPVDGVERRPAMVDLAALVQSVDHVARVVAKYRPDLAAPLDEFITAATAAVITPTATSLRWTLVCCDRCG